MNKCFLVGRLTSDVDLRATSNDKTIAKFTVGIKRSESDVTDNLECVAFDKKAEIIAKYVSKHDKIGIVGRIQARVYTKNDGSKGNSFNILVEEVEFLGSSMKQVKEDDLPF